MSIREVKYGVGYDGVCGAGCAGIDGAVSAANEHDFVWQKMF